MTGITRTGGDLPLRPKEETASSEAAPAADEPEASEFEQVVRTRAEARPVRRGLVPPGGGREGKRLETSRDEAAEARLRAQGAGEASGGARGGFKKSEGEEGRARRDPTADLLAGLPVPAEGSRPAILPKAPAGAHEPLPASEAVARVEEIARRIVEAIELRLEPRGAAEVRIELNLGRLGSLHVAVARSEEGRLRASFEASGEGAAELVRARVEDLRGALEGRGISLHEVTVRGPSSSSEPLPVAAAPSGEEAAWRQGEDQRERQRRQPEPETDEEEG